MLVALKEEAVLGFARKFYVVLLPVCLVAFVALYKATVYMLTTYSYWSDFFNPPGYLDKFRCLSCQLPMVIVFMFIVLLLMLKIRFSNGVLNIPYSISDSGTNYDPRYVFLCDSSAVMFSGTCIPAAPAGSADHQVSVSFRNAGDRGALGFFEDLGVLFVGFFFFCSGYGLITSFENKEHYLKGFLKKRVLLGTKYEMQDLFAAFLSDIPPGKK